MAGWLTYSLSFALLIVYCYSARTKMREYANVYAFEPCPNFTVSASFNASYDYNGKDDYRLNLELTYDKPYDKMQLLFYFYTCQTKERSDCVLLWDFPLDDYCAVQGIDGNWNMVLDNVKPRPTCPLEGTYTIKDYYLSEVIPSLKRFLQIQLVATEIYHFQTRAKHENEYIWCLDCLLSFHLTRKKNPRN